MKRKLLLLAILAICVAIGTYQTLAYYTYGGTAHNVVTMGSVEIELMMSGGETGVMPDTTVRSIAGVENTGKGEAWIRASVQVKPQSAQAIMQLNPDMTWFYKDGYYYYRSPVQPGETTKSLFSSVYFDKAMKNEYQDYRIRLIVTAEAVQTDHNHIPFGGDVSDVKGWPET